MVNSLPPSDVAWSNTAFGGALLWRFRPAVSGAATRWYTSESAHIVSWRMGRVGNDFPRCERSKGVGQTALCQEVMAHRSVPTTLFGELASRGYGTRRLPTTNFGKRSTGYGTRSVPTTNGGVTGGRVLYTRRCFWIWVGQYDRNRTAAPIPLVKLRRPASSSSSSSLGRFDRLRQPDPTRETPYLSSSSSSSLGRLDRLCQPRFRPVKLPRSCVIFVIFVIGWLGSALPAEFRPVIPLQR